MESRHLPATFAVLGLGPMGAAITRAVAAAGHRVATWNRSPRTLTELDLAELPVTIVATAAEAVADAEVVVVCVRDHDASRAVVEQLAPAIAPGAVVVNVSTGTPTETQHSAAHASALGLRYVTGAVMVPTPMVGTPDCLVLCAGVDADVRDARPLLAAIGGTIDVVGTDHAVPPTLDLAMLDVYFAGMYAFLHSAALARAHGIDPARYLPYAEGIVDTLRATLPGLATAIEQRTYDGGEARLDMCLSFLEHIVATSEQAGIDPGLAAAVRDASAAAMRSHPGSTDWDVVAEGFLVR